MLLAYSLLVVGFIILTDGFFLNLFGIEISATGMTNPLAFLVVLLLLRRFLFGDSVQSIARFLKDALLLAATTAILLVANYVTFGHFPGQSTPEFEAPRQISPTPSGELPGSRGWNILLISIDTLRADHLSCYGYARPTSPVIDNLAAGGVRFENHIAAAPSTLPSHASIFTSLYPSTHKAEVTRNIALHDDAETLAEALHKEGYVTAAFTGGGQIDRRYGLDQGFDIYNDDGGGIDPVMQKTIGWLRENHDSPFFLFFHTYETHHPYDPPPPFDGRYFPEYEGPLGREIAVETIRDINDGHRAADEADRRHIEAMYDGEIAYMDSRLDSLFRELKELGIWDSTLILFTSDHGEEFDEHGKVGTHSHTVYDELLQVPLIIRFPDERAGEMVVRRATSGLDVFPTLLDILGIAPLPRFQGFSLLPLLSNPESRAERTILSERESRLFHKALRYGRHKLILRHGLSKMNSVFARMFICGKRASRGVELYDITNDPGETENLMRSDKFVTVAFYNELRRVVEENRLYASAISDSQIEIDEALREKLRALGYFR